MRHFFYNIKWLFGAFFLILGSLAVVPAVSAQEKTEKTPKKERCHATKNQVACELFNYYLFIPFMRENDRINNLEKKGFESLPKKVMEARYKNFCKCMKKTISVYSKVKNENSAVAACEELMIYLATNADFGQWNKVEDVYAPKLNKRNELTKLTEQYESECCRISEIMSDSAKVEQVNDLLNGVVNGVPSALMAKISKKYVGDLDKALKAIEDSLAILKTVKDTKSADEAAVSLEPHVKTFAKLRSKLFKNRGECRYMVYGQDVQEKVPDYRERIFCATELYELLTHLSCDGRYYGSEALQTEVFKLLGCETQREAGSVRFEPKMFTRKETSAEKADSDDEE